MQRLTEDDLSALELERLALLDLQMPSFMRGDEDEDAGELLIL